MRAFAIDAFITPGSVHALPTPSMGPDAILIRVHAAGVNPADWKIRDAVLPQPYARFPMILGVDLARVVERAGVCLNAGNAR